MKKAVLIVLIIVVVIGAWGLPAYAADSNFHLVPECVYKKTNDGVSACTVCDFINLATNLVRIILGIISAVALAMFVLGGFYLIVSGGNEERVSKGKKIMTASVIGVLIVAFAWVGVNTIIGLLSGRSITSIDGTVTIFTNNEDYSTYWWQLTQCKVQNKVKTCSETDNGAPVAVGTPCSQCEDSGGAPGNTNCYCQAYGPNWQEQEADNLCNNNECKCMSLCDKLARDYSAYADYQCKETSKIDIDYLDQCISADVCPHQEGGLANYKCCSSEAREAGNIF